MSLAAIDDDSLLGEYLREPARCATITAGLSTRPYLSEQVQSEDLLSAAVADDPATRAAMLDEAAGARRRSLGAAAEDSP
jgi:hypothetical protein